MPRLFAFDLHGTLIKDNEYAVLEQSNMSLERHGRNERFTLEYVLRLYGRPWADYFRELCSDANDREIASMVKYAESLDDEITPKHVKPMEYAIEILEKIKRRGDITIVISTTNPEALKKYLKWVGIAHLIDYSIPITKDEEQTGSFIVADSKAKKLKTFLEGRKYDEVFMIGDTEDDILAGRKAGAISIFFNPEGETLSKADHSISNLSDVLNLIKNKF